MKKLLSVLMAFVMTTSLFTIAFAENDSSVKFNGDKFKILVLTDTQDDASPSADMLNLITKAIEESDPDLIVFTGDLVEDARYFDLGTDNKPFVDGVVVKKNGEIDHDKTLENIKIASDAVLSVFQESGIPFAIAQGNNDHKCGITDEEWLEIYSDYSNCLVCDMSDDENGEIDYLIPIKDTSGKTIFNIWMLDTGRGNLKDDQLEWYKETSKQITEENGAPIPAFVFQHVPMSDIGNLFEECSPLDDGAGACNNKYYRLNRDIAYGKNFYTYEPREASEEFKAFKECGDVIGAYFGHTHVDGFAGTVDGIELGFTYGSQMAKTGPYGYRLITLDSNDITSFTNEVYTYEGSVKTGNAHFELQDDEVYDNYDNFIEKLAGIVKNLFMSFISLFIELFA